MRAKPKPLNRDLPMPKMGGVESSVVCAHQPVCPDAQTCIRRTMEYCMGRRATP